MPTREPGPMEEAKTETEHLRRMGAVAFIDSILRGFESASYGTRSHMPGGLDYTDFSQSMSNLRSWVKGRPDWAGQVVEAAFRQFGPEESVQIELDRMRALIESFEERSGVSIHEHGYINSRMADAVKVVMELGGPDAFMKKMRTALEDTQHKVRNIDRQLTDLLAGPDATP